MKQSWIMSIKAIVELPNMQNFVAKIPLMIGRNIQAMTLRNL
jgi:hypothetical protein